MKCNTCDELRKYGVSSYPTTIIEKGLAVAFYRGQEIRFKKKIIKCEECGELWCFEYDDGTYPNVLSSLHKIFEIEYEKDPTKWGGSEYMARVMNDIVKNATIIIKEKI